MKVLVVGTQVMETGYLVRRALLQYQVTSLIRGRYIKGKWTGVNAFAAAIGAELGIQVYKYTRPDPDNLSAWAREVLTTTAPDLLLAFPGYETLDATVALVNSAQTAKIRVVSIPKGWLDESWRNPYPTPWRKGRRASLGSIKLSA